MIESLLILNILTLAIIGGISYFYIQSNHNEMRERLETAIKLYDKVISDLQAEKIHLYNCFLDKQQRPPLGVDLKEVHEKRAEETKLKKEQREQGITLASGLGIIGRAQEDARKKEAGII